MANVSSERDRAPTGFENQAPGHPSAAQVPRPGAPARTIVMLLVAVFAQLALIAAFTGALSKPTLRDAEIGLVSSSRPGIGAGPALVPRSVSGLRYTRYSSEASARRAVRDGDVPVAVILEDPTATETTNAQLLVAGAAGPALVAAIT